MKRFCALDGLRGVGAILVVIYHTHVLGALSEFSFFRNGYRAVEFFFVLSGFVMYHAYGQKSLDFLRFKRFLISRTFRIFPLHIVMLIFFIFLEILKYIAGLKGYNFSTPAFSGNNTPSAILPNLFLIEEWLGKPGTGTRSFNTPTWSISIEYYTYLIFGSILLFIPGIKKYLFIFLSILSFVALENHYPYLNNSIFRGLSCFFIGCLCYLVYLEIGKLKLTTKIFYLLEVVSIGIAGAIFPFDFAYKDVVITLSFCLVVISFSFDRGIISAFLKTKIMNHVGKLSYSIYLTHYAILNVILSFAMIAGKISGNNFTPTFGNNIQTMERYIASGNSLIDNFIVILIIAIVLFISGLTYSFIELKGIQYGKQLNKKIDNPVSLPLSV
ncbi:acyltransferase [Pedobacter sp. L105]|uniref:acyltransferase family protein n=1 Tax=Pedobacter sp. L105 TaxID=1641871 RepID=UPI00131D5130|nr:acyltransferase [Pedobacter sp. L105]